MQDFPKKVLASSCEIWDFLIEKAGLDTEAYDFHIVEELCKNLNFSPAVKNIKKELKTQNISPERFIGAFFRSIEPYAQMMTDLCAFFYLFCGLLREYSEISRNIHLLTLVPKTG